MKNVKRDTNPVRIFANADYPAVAPLFAHAVISDRHKILTGFNPRGAGEIDTTMKQMTNGNKWADHSA